MNELLKEAKKRYFDFVFEDLLDELKKEKEHLRTLIADKENRCYLSMKNDYDKEAAVIWPGYKNYEQIFDLIIESVKHEIEVIREYIKYRLIQGEYLDDEEAVKENER